VGSNHSLEAAVVGPQALPYRTLSLDDPELLASRGQLDACQLKTGTRRARLPSLLVAPWAAGAPVIAGVRICTLGKTRAYIEGL
jgi:hypothetical protein